jgi:hypothetical protein
VLVNRAIAVTGTGFNVSGIQGFVGFVLFVSLVEFVEPMT